MIKYVYKLNGKYRTPCWGYTKNIDKAHLCNYCRKVGPKKHGKYVKVEIIRKEIQ